MKTLSLVLFGLAIAALCTATVTAGDQNASRAQQKIEIIDVTAQKYHYTPSTIHVKQGTHVALRITAMDHVHGFKVNVYADGRDGKGAPGLVFADPKNCWRLPKGQVTTIEFTAARAGSYPFKCCVFCGFGHLGMKGAIVVDP